MSEPTKEELLAKITELEKKAASGSKRTGALEFRVGEKGGVSVYGLGRFPVTLYYEQWTRLLDVAADLRAFLEENKHRLKLKTKDESSAKGRLEGARGVLSRENASATFHLRFKTGVQRRRHGRE
jgi:hypothetical protein